MLRHMTRNTSRSSSPMSACAKSSASVEPLILSGKMSLYVSSTSLISCLIRVISMIFSNCMCIAPFHFLVRRAEVVPKGIIFCLLVRRTDTPPRDPVKGLSAKVFSAAGIKSFSPLELRSPVLRRNRDRAKPWNLSVFGP